MIELTTYYQIVRSYDSNLFKIEQRFTNVQLDIDFEALNKKILKDYDLSNVKNIYIGKNVSFPRFKIKDNEKFKNCTEKKAEVIITEHLEPGSRYPNRYYVFKTPDDLYYAFQPWDVVLIENITKNKNVKEGDILSFLISKNILPEGTASLGRIPIRRESKKNLDKIRTVENATLPLVDKTVLEKYLANDNLTPDAESLKNISNLLKSKDAQNISLGIDMLINFNIINNRVKIYNIIKPNLQDIRHKAYGKLQSAVWKNILDQLGFYNTGHFEVSNIKLTMRKFYEQAVNEEDKEEARTILVDLMKEEINRMIQNNETELYNIKFDYNIE
jgi:hypothetical protein